MYMVTNKLFHYVNMEFIYRQNCKKIHNHFHTAEWLFRLDQGCANQSCSTRWQYVSKKNASLIFSNDQTVPGATSTIRAILFLSLHRVGSVTLVTYEERDYFDLNLGMKSISFRVIKLLHIISIYWRRVTET